MQGLRLATGEELYKAVCKLWRKEGLVAFDDTEKCLTQFCTSSGDYNSQAESFKTEYESTSEMQETIPDYMPYKNTLTSYKMPVTKITYEINGQEYVMYLLGDNGVVCYDDLPRTVKAFEMSNVERRKYNSYALERHQELAKLTAYIFNLDGINLEESKSLSLILRHMCMDAYERDRYIRYLTYRYTPEIPAEKILKKAKHLMMSKKLISYVWQCIAVDREISPKEQEFFDKLVTYYNIPESELSSLKRFSSKFATLDDDQFVKEYLDSKPVYFRQKGYLPWLIGMVLGVILFIVDLTIKDSNGFLILLGIAIGVTSFIFFRRNLPPDQKEIDKYYEELCKEPDLDRMEANGSDFLLKIRARIGIFFDRLFGGHSDGKGTIDTFSDVDHSATDHTPMGMVDDDSASNSIGTISTDDAVVKEAAGVDKSARAAKGRNNQTNHPQNIPANVRSNVRANTGEDTTPPPPTTPAPTQLKEEEPKKKGKTGIIIGIIAGILALGAIIGFLVMNNKKKALLREQMLIEQMTDLKTYPWLHGEWRNGVYGDILDVYSDSVKFVKNGLVFEDEEDELDEMRPTSVEALTSYLVNTKKVPFVLNYDKNDDGSSLVLMQFDRVVATYPSLQTEKTAIRLDIDNQLLYYTDQNGKRVFLDKYSSNTFEEKWNMELEKARKQLTEDLANHQYDWIYGTWKSDMLEQTVVVDKDYVYDANNPNHKQPLNLEYVLEDPYNETLDYGLYLYLNDIPVEPSMRFLYFADEFGYYPYDKISDTTMTLQKVYSNAHDGFVNIRQAPESNAPIVGELLNGPEGAVVLDSVGEWRHINCNGIEGYVHEQYVQDTPTEVFQYWGILKQDASIYQFTENDLNPLTAKELTYLRNSMYAKHGYVFKSQELNNYFKKFSWYHPDSSVTDAVLNSIEKENVQFIKNYQEQNGKTYIPQ